MHRELCYCASVTAPGWGLWLCSPVCGREGESVTETATPLCLLIGESGETVWVTHIVIYETQDNSAL